jgi:hypothetical protein
VEPSQSKKIEQCNIGRVGFLLCSMRLGFPQGDVVNSYNSSLLIRIASLFPRFKKKMPQVQHVSVFNLSLKISQAKTSVSITQQDIQIHLLRARDHQICMYIRIISS